jgi:Laminin G domain
MTLNWHVFSSCSCPAGYDGPRCQMTKISFSSSKGYALIKPLQSCGDDKLSFEFMTQSTGSQLLMYAGPDSNAATVPDFISIELVNGFPKLRINLGDGELQLPGANVNAPTSLADGYWHTVEIFRTAEVRKF